MDSGGKPYRIQLNSEYFLVKNMGVSLWRLSAMVERGKTQTAN